MHDESLNDWSRRWWQWLWWKLLKVNMSGSKADVGVWIKAVMKIIKWKCWDDGILLWSQKAISVECIEVEVINWYCSCVEWTLLGRWVWKTKCQGVVKRNSIGKADKGSKLECNKHETSRWSWRWREALAKGGFVRRTNFSGAAADDAGEKVTGACVCVCVWERCRGWWTLK